MIITILYLFSASISLSLGLYNIFNDSKNSINRVFFLLTLTIFCWAFTYALMNISNDVIYVTLFHRIGSIFYSLFYAIFLHFILLITKNKWINKDKNIFNVFLLYIPAIVSIILYFFISPVKVSEHFKTPFGWGHIYGENKNPLIIHFHTFYYILYTIIALICLFSWYKISNYKKEKRQALLLISGISIVLVIGFITDTVFPNVGIYPLPPMGSIELIIPIIFAWYARKKYSLFVSHFESNFMTMMKYSKSGLIITDVEGYFKIISDGASLLLNKDSESLKKEKVETYFPYIQENGLKPLDNFSTFMINSNGFKIPVLLRIDDLFDDYQDKIGYFIIFEDISQINNLQRQLNELNENLEKIVEQRTDQLKKEMEEQILERKKYQTLFDNSHDALAECDDNGIIVNINERFEILFEYSRDEAIGKHIDDAVQDPEKKQEGIEITNKVLENNVLILEDYRLTKNRKKIYTIIRGVPIVIDDKPVGGFAIYTDITKDKENELKLKIMAEKDSLTNLYNFNQFEYFINSSELDEKLPVGLIVSDINGLKFINDSFGHDAGDKLLKSYSNILLKSVRKDDLVFRTGGDEFLIFINKSDNHLIEEVIKRIESNIVKFNNDIEDKTIIINASIGYSLVSEKENIKKDLKKADDMMYRNKLLNKNSNKNTILKILLSALKEKDFITMGHTDRVLVLCRKIAEKMHLDNDKKDNLFLLSEVHDIGKIAIPDAILNKPAKLNADEWEIMRSHAEKGYRIAINSEELSNIADLVLKHHERWDGKGYPLGISGEEIPIECRILSIVDSFDAMISERPYNIVKTKNEAIDEIISLSGKQYDPDIVKVFVEIINEDQNL